jgi:hypothetical protein
MKKNLLALVVLAVGFASSPAFAVIDVVAATTGISDAQTAILSVIAGLMTLATTLFGIMMVYRFVSKKSGVA